MHRVALVLQTEQSRPAIDGIECRLSALSAACVQAAQECTNWPAEGSDAQCSGEPQKHSEKATKSINNLLKKGVAQHLTLKAQPARAKEIAALPGNFARTKQGEKLLRQELQKLLEIDCTNNPSRPLLSADGRVRCKGDNGAIILGPAWEDLLTRAPSAISEKFRKIRNREEYGRAVHSMLVKLTAQLSNPPHSRTDARLAF